MTFNIKPFHTVIDWEHVMKRSTYLYSTLLVMGSLLFAGAASADVGITDNCQDEVQELEKKIEKNGDEYTMESKTRARSELAKAKTNRLDPLKCRKNLQDARQELRKGKQDKRKDD